jgi:uncharacterized protein YbbK (DUF523 family)
MYVVSACLLGENCKYNGGNNYHERVISFLNDKNYIAVCPEMIGGFPAPRPPAEILDRKVYNDKGQELTDAFIKGANETLRIIENKAKELGEEVELAILKAKSPTCGSNKIYDGTFTHTIVSGNGIFADLLIKNGIKVISEEEC